ASTRSSSPTISGGRSFRRSSTRSRRAAFCSTKPSPQATRRSAGRADPSFCSRTVNFSPPPRVFASSRTRTASSRIPTASCSGSQRCAGAATTLRRGTGWRRGPGMPKARIDRFTDTAMKTITGSIVALVTPMHDDGSVDFEALRRLIDWHVAEGTQCIGVVGTTGESPTVSVEEHCEIIRVAVEHARGRIPVMAGTGGNSTAEAIELSRFALKVGADCTLSVVPYYNKPSQEGIYRHFVAVAEAVDIPMVVYNVPSRTVADMQVETVLRLTQVPGIVGIKEATGDIARGSAILSRAPKGFA